MTTAWVMKGETLFVDLFQEIELMSRKREENRQNKWMWKEGVDEEQQEEGEKELGDLNEGNLERERERERAEITMRTCVSFNDSDTLMSILLTESS